ncbi:MAG: glycerophosphodiester phosphodiesterase [Myxococcota bacterium]
MHPFFGTDPHEPMILGHRGAAGDVPENTLLAFETGLAKGAHVLESDIHLSADGIPMLLHDAEVDRTTDGHGPISELSFEAIQRLDAGYHFEHEEGGGTSFRGKGLEIPSLEAAFARFPDARFNLELKSGGPALACAVVDLVQRFDRTDRTLLTAAEDPQMAALRETASDSGVALGACASEVGAFVQAARDGLAPADCVMALQVPAGFGGSALVTKIFVEHAHRYGIAVHVWTINDVPQMETLLDLDVDGLVTDYPARMRALLDQRRARA